MSPTDRCVERCAYPGCGLPLRGNPNDKQCERCLKIFCPKHLTHRDRYGDRWCVDHKP